MPHIDKYDEWMERHAQDENRRWTIPTLLGIVFSILILTACCFVIISWLIGG